MYEAIIYFEGPLSKWRGQPDEREFIYRRTTRFKGLAISIARGRCRGLEQCLWCVRQNGVVIAGEVPVKAGL